LPPCTKGNGLGWEPILLESFVSSFYNSLNNSQRAWWDNLNNGPIKDNLLTFLYSNNFTVQSKYLVKDLIDWLIAENSISLNDIQYFLALPEAGDGNYDQSYWENPNVIFQQIPLPTLQQFIQYFPKITVSGGITFMPSNQVYEMVGGALGAKYNESNYKNACAIRASWAFNNIQVNGTYPFKIDAGTGTEYGANNLSYIVNAKAFNAYMHKRFGNPTHSLTAAQINGSRTNLNNFLKNLRNQNIHGIYTLVTSSGSYTGHIDLMTFGECLGGYSLPENISVIEKIQIWQLH